MHTHIHTHTIRFTYTHKVKYPHISFIEYSFDLKTTKFQEVFSTLDTFIVYKVYYLLIIVFLSFNHDEDIK